MTELTRRTFIIGLCLASAAALAAGKTEATGSLARLKAFLKSTTSARGTFRQTVIDRSGREVSKPSSGYFRFMRPGRFEWTYEKPYVQRIMSDGKTLWIHDPELFQVTEKALEGALPSTPAAILFGERDFEEDWNVTEISDTVLEARPKNPDGSFESVVIEFDARGELAGMELVDTFAQRTTLVFGEIVRERMDPASFRLERARTSSSPPSEHGRTGGQKEAFPLYRYGKASPRIVR